MCQNQQLLTASSGIISISTANSNLDGSGSVTKVITAAGNGTILKTVSIKAIASNAQGMIRLFLEYAGSETKRLWREIPIPANVQSSTVPAYQTTIRAGITMAPGDALYASTQNAETWNIIAEAVDWSNCSCPE